MGPKNALFRYFWTRIWKKYGHIWNQHVRICLLAKFCKKNENALMWDPYLGTFVLEFEKAIAIYEISILALF